MSDIKFHNKKIVYSHEHDLKANLKCASKAFFINIRRIGQAIYKHKFKILIGSVILIITLFTATILSIHFLSASGKKSLEDTEQAVVEGSNLYGESCNTSIQYGGSEYAYKKGLVNILILGIDNDLSMDDTVSSGDLGQSDAIYVLSIDTYNNEASLIGIPRDTMVPIQIQEGDDNYYNTQTLQITLQYAYGSNCITGSTLTAKAVSALLYNIPIQRVCAINLNSVSLINDAVGGVTLTVPNTFTDESNEIIDPEFVEGNTVTLMGEQALLYVRERDCSIFASSMDRVSRQEQYIDALMNTAKNKIKNNILLPFHIVHELDQSGYLYCDLSFNEYVYLAKESLNLTIDEDSITTIPGEVKTGEEFEEYYVNSDELKKLVIQTFYTKLN